MSKSNQKKYEDYDEKRHNNIVKKQRRRQHDADEEFELNGLKPGLDPKKILEDFQ